MSHVTICILDFCRLLNGSGHNYAVATLSHTPSTAVAELMHKHGGWCLLRPVRVDQSQGALTTKALRWSIQTECEQRWICNGQ